MCTGKHSPKEFNTKPQQEELSLVLLAGIKHHLNGVNDEQII